MNKKLEDELAKIAGSDQNAEVWRNQGQYWALFFQGARAGGLDDAYALHLTKNCYERMLYVLVGQQP